MGSDPNTLPEIQLRGASTFADVNDLQLATRAELNLPLFILDGFEVSLERVMDLNNDDIEKYYGLERCRVPPPCMELGSKWSGGYYFINS